MNNRPGASLTGNASALFVIWLENTNVVHEKLKAKDQMAWVAQMNNIRQRVEEMVLDELIYG